MIEIWWENVNTVRRCVPIPLAFVCSHQWDGQINPFSVIVNLLEWRGISAAQYPRRAASDFIEIEFNSVEHILFTIWRAIASIKRYGTVDWCQCNYLLVSSSLRRTCVPLALLRHGISTASIIQSAPHRISSAAHDWHQIHTNIRSAWTVLNKH